MKCWEINQSVSFLASPCILAKHACIRHILTRTMRDSLRENIKKTRPFLAYIRNVRKEWFFCRHSGIIYAAHIKKLLVQILNFAFCGQRKRGGSCSNLDFRRGDYAKRGNLSLPKFPSLSVAPQSSVHCNPIIINSDNKPNSLFLWPQKVSFATKRITLITIFRLPPSDSFLITGFPRTL